MTQVSAAPTRRLRLAVLMTASVAGLGGGACVTKDDARKLVEALEASQPPRPDVLPVIIGRDPVRYPPALYARRAQGNVTLRIFIDSTGRVRPESTRVEETSGEPAFDSAAIAGARGLRFTPAMRKGVPMAVSVLFPVYFRHPQGAPVPGDSILHRAPPGGVPGETRGDTVGK